MNSVHERGLVMAVLTAIVAFFFLGMKIGSNADFAARSQCYDKGFEQGMMKTEHAAASKARDAALDFPFDEGHHVWVLNKDIILAAKHGEGEGRNVYHWLKGTSVELYENREKEKP